MVHGEVVGLMNGELVMGGILEGDRLMEEILLFNNFFRLSIHP